METLRKLSSMGRTKEKKEAARIAVQQASEDPEGQRVNGGGADAQEAEAAAVSPSPPRARVTDDGDDEVEVAGEDDGYDSAVEKMGTSSTPSVVGDSQAPKEAEAAPISFAQALRKGSESQKEEEVETETESKEDADAPREASSNSADEESSSSISSSAGLVEQDEEDDAATLTRQTSVRAMPVAKLTTENEEQEEEVDEDDEEEGDNEDEYEEANDQVLGEEEDAHVARDANAVPRIIARETADDHFDAVDSKGDESNATSSVVEEAVDQAASTPLPDESDDQVEKSISTEFSATEIPEPAAPSPGAEENADDIPVEEPRAEDEAVEVRKEEDSSNVEEKSVDEVTNGREDSTPAVVAEDQQEDSSSAVDKSVDEVTSDREDSTPAVFAKDQQEEEEAVEKSVDEVTSGREDPTPAVADEDQQEDSPYAVEKSIDDVTSGRETPTVADDQQEEKETVEKSIDEVTSGREDPTPTVVAEDQQEDSSNIVDKSVDEVTSGREDPTPAVAEDQQEEEAVEKSVDDVTSDREDPTPAAAAAAQDQQEDSPYAVEKSVDEVTSGLEDPTPAVAEDQQEDSPSAVEKSVDDVTSGREDPTPAVVAEDQQEKEEAVPEVLAEAASSLAEPAPVDIGVKEDVAPEVAPLAIADVGSVSKKIEVEETAKETEQAAVNPQVEVESRSASFSEEEEKSEIVTDTAAAEPSQSVVEEEKKESTAREPAPVTEPKVSASKSLLSEADAKKAGEATSERSGEQSAEKDQDSNELVVDQKVVDSPEGVTGESLNELKELTYGLHVHGRSESEVSEVQSALAANSDSAEKTVADSTSTVAVSESLSPEVAEVRIIEESKPEDVDPAAVKEELAKEDAEGPAAVPSPAKLQTALNAVDSEASALKSANGDVAETENVQVKPRGFSAADFTGEEGDSDADAEDDDDDNDDDEDDDEDETDMDTAKALAELANVVGKSGETANKPSMGAAGPSLPSLPQRPAARKSAAASALDTAGRITQRPTVTSSTQLTTTTDDSSNGETAEGNETREKLQNIRVKFLRLAHRLGQSPQNVVVAQVLYRLGLAESLRGGSAPNRTGAFSFDRANALAEEQEAANQEEELDFACTILVLGKTGVGKSATINSIFDDRKSVTSAFKPATNKVQEIVGTVHGIKVRVIDTPGLLPSVADQQHNERIMGQVKKHIKKASPDIVLYFDRLDMQSRDYGDLPLLRTITDLFGAAVWFNAIVVLTHASSAPPDGPNGVPLSYEMFVAQRSHVVQQTIRQAAGDMRLMNPVSLVENHPACRTNRNGQRVLPNGQIWKPQLLLLCFASKILAEANSLLKLQETATPGRPFGQRSRVPPLPFLLSSLLQSRAQLKLPDEQLGESDESDDDEEEEDSDADDYDELPPFRPLSKEELEDLDKEQKQQYMEEITDRERLFQKKQYREEMRRRKEMKKRAAQMSKEELAQPDEADDEAGKAAAVPVPMPDMALPPSFDSDNPTHRYRYLETGNQWLVRPVLETHGWDHDAGYDGFNVEKMFVVKDKIPASVSGQVTKDKKEAQVNFEAAASLKHGEGKVTLTGFDIQTIGKDLAYTLRAETRFNNWRRNKTTAGVTCTVLNDTIAAGLKLEDRILIGKRMKMVVNGGVLTGKGDKAFGGSLEATLRGKEYPLSRTLSTLGLSVMDWHGDLAIGGNLQSQLMVGKTMLVGRANLNNRGSGQVSIRASSSEQLQMALIGIVPILRSLINCRFGFGGQSSQ